MCGIVGAVAEKDVVSILVEGLRRLEYRGYDSAGVAVIDADKRLSHGRAIESRIESLVDAAIEHGELTEWFDGRWLVNQADLDVGGTERAAIDIVIAARALCRVQRVNQQL